MSIPFSVHFLIQTKAFFFFLAFAIMTGNSASVYAQSEVQNLAGFNEPMQIKNYRKQIDQHLKKHLQNVSFVENKGQWNNPDMYYQAKGSQVSIQFLKDMVSFGVQKSKEKEDSQKSPIFVKGPKQSKPYDSMNNNNQEESEGFVWNLKFLGTLSDVCITAKDQRKGSINYFKGSNWTENIRAYNEVWYENVYSNTDLRFYSKGDGSIEYDFIIYPGGSFEEIRLEMEGIKELFINEKGELVFKTPFGDLKKSKPYTYQMIEGEEVAIASSFQLEEDQRIGFNVATYDPNYPLIIDPTTLVWSSLLGGQGSERLYNIRTTAAGEPVVLGRVNSAIFPTTAGVVQDAHSGNYDYIISKFSADGSALLFSTYLGGSGLEDLDEFTDDALQIGTDGSIYVIGRTSSTDYPVTSGAFQTTFGGGAYDMVISKLNSDGSSLIYSTYIGGESSEQYSESELSSGGELYIAGRVGVGLPTTPTAPNPDPIDTLGQSDGYLLKLNASGTALEYSTYIGFQGFDWIQGLAITSANEMVVVSQRGGPGLPTTPGVINPDYDGEDAYIAKLNSTGTAWEFVTYYGGTGWDEVWDIALDSNDDIYVTGTMDSEDFPVTPGAYQTKYKYDFSLEGFVSKISSDGSSFIYSTLLGSYSSDLCYRIRVTAAGEAIVAGEAAGMDFPVKNGYPNTSGTYEGFITKLNADGSDLVFSTFCGWIGDYYSGGNIHLDSEENIYVLGYDEPPIYTADAFLKSNENAFFVKYNPAGDILYATSLYGQVQDFSITTDGAVYITGASSPTNFPVTQGAYQTSGGSSFDGFVLKLDLCTPVSNNSISPSNQTTCINGTPNLIVGEEVQVTTPVVLRNGVEQASQTPAIIYKWEYSTDLSNWNTINGATEKDYQPESVIQTTYFRRVVNEGCSSPSISNVHTLTINAFTAPTIDAGLTQGICPSGSAVLGGTPNGTGSVVVSGGQAPFNYQWSPATGLDNSAIEHPTATPSADALYTVVVTDANSCVRKAQTTVVIVEADAGADQTYCPGGSAVRIGTALPPNANGFTYSWTVLSGDMSSLSASNVPQPTVNPTVASQYELTVSGPSGCPDKDTVNVSLQTLPVADAGPDTSICMGSSVQLGVAATAGYSYLWSSSINGFSNTTDNDPTFTADGVPPAGLNPIPVYLRVTESGCVAYDTAYITVDTFPVIDLINYTCGDPIQPGYAVTPQTGLTYRWYTNAPDLPASNYMNDTTLMQPIITGATVDGITFYVETENIGECATTDFVNVFSPCDSLPACEIPSLPVNQLTVCSTLDSVSLYPVAVQDGFSYSWETEANTLDGILTNASEAVIWVRPAVNTKYVLTATFIEDPALSCTDTIEVFVAAAPVANAGSDTITCPGQAVPIGSSAIGGYSYQWTAPNESMIVGNANPSVSPAISKTYTLQITDDATGCIDTAYAIVTVRETQASIGPDAKFCEGAFIRLGENPAAPDNTYDWSPGIGLSDSVAAQPTVTLYSDATFYLMVTDTVTGCIARDTATFEKTVSPVVDAGKDMTVCEEGASVFGGSVSYPKSGNCDYTLDLFTTSTYWRYNYVDVTINGVTTSYTYNSGGPSSYTFSLTDGDVLDISIRHTNAYWGAYYSRVYNYSYSITDCNSNVVFQEGPYPSPANGLIPGSRYNTIYGYSVNIAWIPSSGVEDPSSPLSAVTPPATTTYTLYARTPDYYGCDAFDDVIITLDRGVSCTGFDAGADQTTCPGQAVGIGSADPGNTLFTWVPQDSIDNPNIAQPTVNPTTPTTYYVTAVDTLSGLATIDSVTITINNELVDGGIDAGADREICIGDDTTLGTVSVSDVTYSWSPATNLSATNVAQPIANPSSNITYYLTATHNTTGCVLTDSVQIVVIDHQADAGVDQSFCATGVTIGTAAVAGYSYSWTPAAGLSNTYVAQPTATPNKQTSYILTVFYTALGCSDTDTVIVTPDAEVSVLQTTYDLCQGDTVQIGGPSSGGTYTYSWSPTTAILAGEETTAQPHVFPSTSTTYTVTITNTSTGCTRNASVTVNVSNPIADAGEDISSCQNTTQVVGTSAVSGFDYSWSPASAVEDDREAQTLALIGTQNETLILTVTEINSGCIARDTINITVNTSNGPVADAGPDTTYCPGSSVVIGTAAVGGLVYSWSPTTDLNDPNIAQPEASPDGAISYTLTVYDPVSGCSNQDMVSLEEKFTYAANGGDPVTYCKNSDPTTSDMDWYDDNTFTVSWSPMAGITAHPSYGLNYPYFSPDTTTVYTFTITDSTNGCSSSDELTVYVVDETFDGIAPADDHTICEGSSVEIGNAPVSGYAYRWLSYTSLLSNRFIANPEATPTDTTTFRLRITAPSGCLMYDTVTVNVSPNVDPGPDQIICENASSGVVIGTSPEAGYTYSWLPTTGLSDPNVAQPTAQPTATTIYSLTRTNSTVGCATIGSVTVQVNPIPLVDPFAGPSVDTTIQYGESVQLGITNLAGYTYTWEPSIYLNDSSVAQPTSTPFRDISYTLNVSDGTCMTSSSFLINVLLNNTAVGNYVWLDEDGDGDQDVGEAGIADVVVELLNSTGSIIQTTQTDTEGGYLFRGIGAGTYTVRVNTSSLAVGLNNQTADPDVDMDSEHTFTLVLGDEKLDIDFGYNWATATATNSPIATHTGAIGDRIWLDVNNNGLQEPEEAGIQNVSVQLFSDPDLDGIYTNLESTTTSNAQGYYVFDGISVGAYVVKIDSTSLPSGINMIPSGDPDGDGTNTTEPFVLAPGDVYVNLDFGYPPSSDPADVGNLVFIDANANGMFDSGEAGIAGVTVALIDNTGAILATAYTDAAGNYTFPDINDGMYTVWITDTENVLEGWSNTADPDGNLSGQSEVTISGSNNFDQDFGYAPQNHQSGYGLVGDFVFLDVNGSNSFDAGDTGLEGVDVELLDGSMSVVDTATTNENGQYLFGGLSADNYTIRILTASLPTGLTNSVDPNGGNDNVSTVVLASGQIETGQDFGYSAASSNRVEGTVFEDSNADGALNESSVVGFQNVVITLLDSDGHIIGTTSTDANGDFGFDGLPNGTYIVNVTDQLGILTGYWHADGSNDGADNNSQDDPYTVTLSGATNSTADFGYYIEGASLGNYCWEDDGDGVQEAGEPALNGVVVRLEIDYDGDGIIETAMVDSSDASGYYDFKGLLFDEDNNGTGALPAYSITAVAPLDYMATSILNVNGNSQDKEDSDDPESTTAQALQGSNAVQTNADPNLETAAASYDFGFEPICDVSSVEYVIVADASKSLQTRTQTTGYFLQSGGTGVSINDSQLGSISLCFTDTMETGSTPFPLYTIHNYQLYILDDGILYKTSERYFDSIELVGMYLLQNGSIESQTISYTSENCWVNQHHPTAKSGSIRLTDYCVDGNWRYYYSSNDPDEYGFAIEMGANTTEIAHIDIRVDDECTDRYAADANDASFVMIRDWHVETVNNDPLSSAVNIRFYFPPNEFQQMLDSAKAQATNWGVGLPSEADVIWFKKDNFDPDADINTIGSNLLPNDITNLQANATSADGTNTSDNTPAIGNGKNYIQFNGITGFSGGTAMIHINRMALPVELTEFNGSAEGCNVYVNWFTQSEDGFDHFDLERSFDGQSFVKIETVQAAGGQANMAYQYYDQAAAAKNYYRLKMVDLDGSFVYSAVIQIQTECDIDQDAMLLYPNPIGEIENIVTIKFYSGSEEVSIYISDMLGRQLRWMNLSTELGWNTLRINVSDLPSGNYFVTKKELGGKQKTVELIIQE